MNQVGAIEEVDVGQEPSLCSGGWVETPDSVALEETPHASLKDLLLCLSLTSLI